MKTNAEVSMELFYLHSKKILFLAMGGVLLVYFSNLSGIISAFFGEILKVFDVIFLRNKPNIIIDSSIYAITVSIGHGTFLVNQKNRRNSGLRKERSKWEIIQDILNVLWEEKNSKKTRIMQRACLDWRNFKRYFDFLLEEGFIEKNINPKNEVYNLTKKGCELLDRLNGVDEILKRS